MQDINTVGRLFMDRQIKPHNLRNHNHNHNHNQQILKCPRCESSNTKFCYYNNYNLSQPRHFCKNCRRYWTKGGVLRNVPVGGGCRKPKPKSKPKPKPKPKPGSPCSDTSYNNINNNNSQSICQIGDTNLSSGELNNNNNNNNDNNNNNTTSFSDLMENQSGGMSGPNEVNPTVRIEDLLENKDWENPTVENGDYQGLFDFNNHAYWSQTTSTLNWTPSNSFTNDLPLFLP